MCDCPAALPGFPPTPFPVDLRSVGGFDKDEKVTVLAAEYEVGAGTLERGVSSFILMLNFFAAFFIDSFLPFPGALIFSRFDCKYSVFFLQMKRNLIAAQTAAPTARNRA